MKRHTGVLLLVLPALMACGKDAAGPRGPDTPALEIAAGAGVSDTIGVVPAQGLVVQLRGLQDVSGVLVNFDAPPADRCVSLGYACSRMLVGSALSTGFSSGVSTRTDADGRALVRVRLGDAAGAGMVVVTAPEYGIADTALYTVLPGAGVLLRLTPRDTAVELGSAFRLRPVILDRAGNTRADPIAYQATSPALSVDAGGQVSGRALGAGYVRVAVTLGTSTRTDSTRVVVAPAGRFAVAGYSGPLRLQRLVGDTGRLLVSGSAIAPEWSPQGDRIVYSDGHGLFFADTLGNTAALPTPGVGDAMWPRFSADGQWLYFQSGRWGGQLYRMHVDGSGLQQLAGLKDGRYWPLQGEAPAPSPDGTRVAFAAGDWVLVLTPASGKVDTVFTGVATHVTSWSPDGQWIACIDVYGLHVLRPDGTQQRRIVGNGTLGIAWSPDSRSLVVGTPDGLALADLTAGTLYPLGTSGGYASWRPER